MIVFRAVTIIVSKQNCIIDRDMRATRVEIKKRVFHSSVIAYITNIGSYPIHPFLKVQNFKIHQKCNRRYIF